MPELSILVVDATVVPFAVTPMIGFRLHVTNSDPEERIHTVVLRCQIQLEVTRRRYTAQEKERLRDLFGEPERWGQTLRNLLWANTSVVVPPFSGGTTAELQVPCTFDFSVATTKYFDGLAEGDVPVSILFSGSVFHEDAAGALSVAPISWNTETRFRMPLKIWKEMMDVYYPNNAWLCLRRDVFEDLHRFKVERGIPTWEQALETMLALAHEKETAVRA